MKYVIVTAIAHEPLSEAMLAVLVPSLGNVTIEWATHYRRLRLPEDTIFHAVRGYPVDIARNILVKLALEKGADRILFIDDDVIVPEDGINKLIAVQDDLMSRSTRVGAIVAGRYDLRIYDGERFIHSCYLWDPKQEVYTLVEPKGTVYECDGVPMGITLIHSGVFDRLSKPWFKWTSLEGNNGMSEDLFFCTKAREELGISPVCVPEVYGKHFTLAKIYGGQLTL